VEPRPPRARQPALPAADTDTDQAAGHRDEPTAFYDLFRVEGGKLAEHWDVVFTQPEKLPSGNDLF
jgi:predicted SnoaL-like aldol condensation-catalyzing enzyme